MDPSSTELEWLAVSTALLRSPDDLELWKKLTRISLDKLTKASPAQDVALARQLYDLFLERFPLLYNYWIQYAELELRLGNTKRAELVYRRGLAGLTYCVELWVAFLEFKMTTLTNNLEEVLDTFEMARDKIGYHYHAYEFYRLYLDFLQHYRFEKQYYLLLRVVLEVPLYHYLYFFKKWFDTIAKFNHLEGSERDHLLTMVVPALEMDKAKRMDNKQLVMFLKKYFVDLYIATQFRVYEMYPLEKELDRPYFDVAPLSKQQLDAWDLYTTFIELRSPSESATILAYERAVVATANYPQLWHRYLRWTKSRQRRMQILRRAVRFCRDPVFVVQLADEYAQRQQFLAARDVVVEAIAHVTDVPFMWYELLLLLEWSMSAKDEDAETYWRSVLDEIINTTNLDYWFIHMLDYSVSANTKNAILTDHADEFGSRPLYQRAQATLSGPPASPTYDEMISQYL